MVHYISRRKCTESSLLLPVVQFCCGPKTGSFKLINRSHSLVNISVGRVREMLHKIISKPNLPPEGCSPSADHIVLCYMDASRRVTYPYPILVGYADTDTRIHHFSGISFDKVRIRVSDTYCIGYPYPYSCNIDIV
jgi:hypothetical protein